MCNPASSWEKPSSLAGALGANEKSRGVGGPFWLLKLCFLTQPTTSLSTRRSKSAGNRLRVWESACKEELLWVRQYAETELAGSRRGQSCFLDVINRKGVGQPQSENQFFYGVRCLQFRAHRKFLTFFYYPGKCSCFGGIVSVQQTFVLNLRQRCE